MVVLILHFSDCISLLQAKHLMSAGSSRDYLGTPYIPVNVTIPVSENSFGITFCIMLYVCPCMPTRVCVDLDQFGIKQIGVERLMGINFFHSYHKKNGTWEVQRYGVMVSTALKKLFCSTTPL